MKKIKTIIRRRDYAVDFDLAVNRAIEEGWTLVRRYSEQGFTGGNQTYHPVLIAELEREA